MSIIPTAEEFYIQKSKELYSFSGKEIPEDIKIILLEFTKLHVKAALEAANNKVRVREYPSLRKEYLISREDDILDAYPESNIK